MNVGLMCAIIAQFRALSLGTLRNVGSSKIGYCTYRQKVTSDKKYATMQESQLINVNSKSQ